MNYWKIWTLLAPTASTPQRVTRGCKFSAFMAQRSAHELHAVPQVTGQKYRALPNATHKTPHPQHV